MRDFSEVLIETTEIMSEIRDIFSSLMPGTLTEDCVSNFIRLKESVIAARSRLYERTRTASQNIELLTSRLKMKKPLKKNDILASNENMIQFVLNTRQVLEYSRFVMTDEAISSDLTDLKELYETLLSKLLDFKETIHLYNETFPEQKLTTIEDAQAVCDKVRLEAEGDFR